MKKKRIKCGAPHCDPRVVRQHLMGETTCTLRCTRLAGHKGEHRTPGVGVWWDMEVSACENRHPEQGWRCHRDLGHAGSHAQGDARWPATPRPPEPATPWIDHYGKEQTEPRCAVVPCELAAHKEGDPHRAHRSTGRVSWYGPNPPAPSPEKVDHPAHYGGKDNPYEAIKVIEAWALGFSLGNCVKYIARAGKKGSMLEDLKKARWYLDREITRMEKYPFGLTPAALLVGMMIPAAMYYLKMKGHI